MEVKDDIIEAFKGEGVYIPAVVKGPVFRDKWNGEAKVEIENKYLLKKVPVMYWDKGLLISQYYIDGFRYRKTQETGKSDVYECIQKVKTGSNSAIEHIFDVTKDEFIKIVSEHPTAKRIIKKRLVHWDEEQNLNFEVDVFLNINLVMLEVELRNSIFQIKFPDDIKDCIIKEVTNDEAFYNSNLAI